MINEKKSISIVTMSLVLSSLFGGSLSYAAGPDVLGDVEVTPSASYADIIGDKGQFQSDYWTQGEFTGGVPEFNLIKEYKDGTSVEIEGRVVEGNHDHDYLFDMNVKKEGLGSLNFEFKQFRKYYDGVGGFYAPFRSSSLVTWQQTSRALFMDIGNLKVEGVLDKENAPKTTVSYEREYRLGTKSLISWGPVVGPNPQGGSTTRYILPTFLEIDEIVDKLHMKVEDTIKGVDVSLEQSWERARIDTQKCNNRSYNLNTGAYTNIRYKYEDLDSDSYTTAFNASKEMNENALFSFAALYNYYRGHTIETITDTSTATTNENNPNSPASIINNSIVVLPNLSFTLFEHVLMDLGLRWEFVNKQGDANYNRDTTNPPDNILDQIAIVKTENNENKIGESFDLKYDGIRDVSLFLRGQFEQQVRQQNETENSMGIPIATVSFGRNATIFTYKYDCDTGFKWYVAPKVDVTADVAYSYTLHTLDQASRVNDSEDVLNGYRGYIDDLSISTLKPTLALNYKPFKRLACTFRYIFINTYYGVLTKSAGRDQFSEYIAQLYSASATFTPYEQLYLTFFFQKKDASTATPLNGNGGRGGVNNLPQYNANVNTLNTSFGYSPFKDCTFRGSYGLSLCDNFNDYSNTGIPLGLDNYLQNASVGIEQKIRADCSLEFRYNFMQYDETSNAGIDSYQAHLFDASLKMKF